MARRHEEEEEPTEEARVSSLQLLNAAEAKVEKPKAPTKGLIYIDTVVKGKTSRALVDTGATHNFLDVKEAKRLGVEFTKEKGLLKAINSAARPTEGVAYGVKLYIGAWSGLVDFSVAHIDDYPMVLGMDFFDKVKAFPIPYANSVCIAEEGMSCTVPMIRQANTKSKKITAMQLSDAGETSDLAALKEKGDSQKSAQVIPKELPKKPPFQGKEVDDILAEGVVHRKGMPEYTEYLVKWKGLPESKASWEREESLRRYSDHIKRFKVRLRDEDVAGLGGGE